MRHIPLVKTKDIKKIVEFSHINQDAKKGTWKKENLINLDNIKINVFLQGDFSVVVNDMVCNPVYGDLCVLAPHTIHYGQISKATHTDYFQFDIGTDAFDGVPGGRDLLLSICKKSSSGSAFLRPNKSVANQITDLCLKAERAVESGKIPLAFSYVIEIVSHMDEVYSLGAAMPMQPLSKHVSYVVNYIEKNFGEKIKIESLARECSVSTSYLSRQFKKEVGISLHLYLNNYRIMQSSYMIGDKTVAEVAYLCGFCDSSHYITSFKKVFGTTPLKFK